MPHLYPFVNFGIYVPPEPPLSYSYAISIFAKLEYGNEKICKNITPLIDLETVAGSQKSAHPVVVPRKLQDFSSPAVYGAYAQ